MADPIVILGATHNVLESAKRLDRPLILAGTNPRIALELESPYDESFEVDYTDTRAFSAFCTEVLSHRRVTTVTSLTEDGQLPAAIARDLIGVPGLPFDVVKRTVDKLEMRKRLTEVAPEVTIPAVTVADPLACADLLKTFGSLVGKPTSGTGSAGFRLIENEQSLGNYLAACSESDGDFFVEPFVDGKEFTVETFSVSGKRTHVGIVEKWLSSERVELAHLLSQSLSVELKSRIESAVSLALDALGVDSGATCTEVFVSPVAVTIIETHTRPGGDGLADLIHVVTGIDWRASALEAALGGSLIKDQPSANAAGIVFWTAPAGRITRIRTDLPEVPADILQCLVTVKVGDRVMPLRSSDDRLGAVLLSAASGDACRSAIDMLMEAGIVETS